MQLTNGINKSDTKGPRILWKWLFPTVWRLPLWGWLMLAGNFHLSEINIPFVSWTSVENISLACLGK